MKYLRVAMVLGGSLAVQSLPAALIGVDAVHGYDTDTILSSGADYDTFRTTIVGLGHTIVPLTSFTGPALAGLDGLILNISYRQNAQPYTVAEIAAIGAFVQKGVFLSDTSLWSDPGAGSDRPITFGNNQLLLQNAIGSIVSGGAIFTGDDGSGYDVGNFNQLVGQFGISYAQTPTDGFGRTVSGFVPHPVTAGLSSIGVDFQLPITSTSPAVDLTIGSGQDNVLAVSLVPEPAACTLLALGSIVLVMARRWEHFQLQ